MPLPTAWSTVNGTLPAAWRSVRLAAQPDIGMVIDAFYIFARGLDAGDLDDIPAGRIDLVQLSDLAHPVEHGAVADMARHRRLLPGAGYFPIDSPLQWMKAIGYEHVAQLSRQALVTE